MEKSKKTIKRIKVKKISIKPNADVFDLTVKNNHNFFANTILVHNCFEIGMIPVTNDGVCGVQFCNLSSINGRLTDTKEKFKECVEAETIIGTLQAGYTNFPYLSNIAKK